MDKTIDYYDELACTYEQLAAKKMRYLNAIDTLIYEHVNSAERYLDIGAGDGHRSLKIAKELAAEHVVLLDTSSEITKNITLDDTIELFVGYLEEYKADHPFNLITSLWNVLGHVGDRADKLRFLADCKNLLSKDGILVIDVNNRYNISHYGTESVTENLKKDINSDTTSGFFDLVQGRFKTKVYIHAPFELDSLLEKTGLEIKNCSMLTMIAAN